MNILIAGISILVAAGAIIVAVLTKMAVKEIRDPQREVQPSLPAEKPKAKDKDHELQHV
jgi:hypothetical protein